MASHSTASHHRPGFRVPGAVRDEERADVEKERDAVELGGARLEPRLVLIEDELLGRVFLGDVDANEPTFGGGVDVFLTMDCDKLVFIQKDL